MDAKTPGDETPNAKTPGVETPGCPEDGYTVVVFRPTECPVSGHITSDRMKPLTTGIASFTEIYNYVYNFGFHMPLSKI